MNLWERILTLLEEAHDRTLGAVMENLSARRLRKAYTMRIFLFGLATVFLLTIPVLNIIVPVLAAAAMVHLYESLPRKLEFEAEGFDDSGADGTQFGTDAPASGNLRS